MKMPKAGWAFFLVGLLFATQSGNFTRLAEAHSLMIAFWRLALASMFFLCIWPKGILELVRAPARLYGSMFLSGAFLAGHFFFWNEAIQNTTVANAAVFFALNPMITGLLEWLCLRDKPSLNLWLGLGLGLAGAIVTGFGGMEWRGEQMWGDMAGFLSGALFSGYFLIGRRAMNELPITSYVTGVYGIAAILCGVGGLLWNLPFKGYGQPTILAFILLAGGSTILGHTAYNYGLRYFKASKIGLCTLLEPMLASIGALAVWGEKVPLATVLGFGFIGAAIVVISIETPRSSRAYVDVEPNTEFSTR